MAQMRQMAQQFGITIDDTRPRVVMQFSANPNDMLLSGTLANGQFLANRAAALDHPLGKGHVVMFAIRPFWRWQTQGTYTLGFNAIMNWNDLDAGKAAAGARGTDGRRGQHGEARPVSDLVWDWRRSLSPCSLLHGGRAGAVRREGELRQARGDDPDARWREAVHDHLLRPSRRRRRAIPDPDDAHRVRHRAVRAGRITAPCSARTTSSPKRATSSCTRTRAGSSSRRASSSITRRSSQGSTEAEREHRHLGHDRLAGEERPNNNGRVGQWGISWAGWEVSMGMIDAHPALKASSPQAPPQDQFFGDDYHSGGAFQLMYGFNWMSTNARARVAPYGARRRAVRLRHAGRLSLLPRARRRRERAEVLSPTMCRPTNDHMTHGTYDEYWQARNVPKDLVNITHPVLIVAAWFDAQDFYGPFRMYRALKEKNPANKTTLAVGPWLHGGWARSDGDTLGHITFGVEDRRVLPHEHRAAVLQLLPEGQGQAEPRRSGRVRDRRQPVARRYDRMAAARARSRGICISRPAASLSFTAPDDRIRPTRSTTTSAIRRSRFRTPRRSRRPKAISSWSRISGSSGGRPDVLVYQTRRR